MQVKNLKKYASQKLLKLYIATLIAAAIFALMLNYDFYLTSESDKQFSNFNRMNREILLLQSHIERLQSLENEWRNISFKQKEGLQVTKLRESIKNLQTIHPISGITVSLSTPEYAPQYNIENLLKVENSIVTITFKALTDLQALEFYDDLIDAFEGYLILQTFNMKAVRNIDQTVLSRIASGSLDYLVEVSMTLQWRDIENVFSK